MGKYICVDKIKRGFSTAVEGTEESSSGTVTCRECNTEVYTYTNLNKKESYLQARQICKNHICQSGWIPKAIEEIQKIREEVVKLREEYAPYLERYQKVEDEEDKREELRSNIYKKIQYIKGRKRLLGIEVKK
jgi:hypothetical protein